MKLASICRVDFARDDVEQGPHENTQTFDDVADGDLRRSSKSAMLDQVADASNPHAESRKMIREPRLC